MARYHISIMRPPGYVHSDCFYEVAEGLQYGLEELGHRVSFQENWIEPTATSIVLGAHALSEVEAAWLPGPGSVVVYNLEQLGISYVPPWYPQLAAKVQIWDFSARNIALWGKVPCASPPKLVEIGYVPQLRRIVASPDPDIDVLFYGSVTARRERVLNALSAEGLRVHVAYGVYRAERDALIARAKIVLNLHAAETRVLESVRVSYLLANSKAVVTEESDDLGGLSEAVAVCTCETAAEVCKRLVNDDRERRELEERGFRLFSARSQAEILASAVGRASDQALST